MTDRKVLIRYSDDGGRNWSDWMEESLGEQGQYGTRVRVWRLGRFVNRIFEVKVSSPIQRDLLTAVAYMERTKA